MNETKRPSWDDIFIEECKLWAKRSSCCRIQTASVIVKDNHTISTGYNGTCTGLEHCYTYWEKYIKENNKDNNWLSSEEFYRKHHEWSNSTELHAEQNAITFAAKNGYSVNNCTLYTLYSPCINCAKVIVSSGISKIVYEYTREPSGLKFCKNMDVLCEQYNVKGFK